MLIKLGKWLRAAGYDTWFIGEKVDDIQMLNIAVREKRVLLTCDKDLLEKHENVIFFSSCELEKCVKELNRQLKINWTFSPFSRCLECNHVLKRIDKVKIIEVIPEQVGVNYNEFKICSKCQKIYWQGSHAEDMLETLKRWNSI